MFCFFFGKQARQIRLYSEYSSYTIAAFSDAVTKQHHSGKSRTQGPSSGPTHEASVVLLFSRASQAEFGLLSLYSFHFTLLLEAKEKSSNEANTENTNTGNKGPRESILAFFIWHCSQTRSTNQTGGQMSHLCSLVL